MANDIQAAAGQNMARRLPFTGRVPVDINQLNPYNPNRPDAVEAIWQPQFDFQAYPTTGQTQLQFFQVPVGQSSKTLADTNMVLAGQFPAPTAFLCTALMVAFFPWQAGTASNTGTAAAVNSNLNDVVKVANSGYLQLTIGSKVYNTDAPLGKFPPNFSVGGLQTISGTYTAQAFSSSDFARSIGRYYEITPLLIPMNQNFSVGLFWPTAVTVAQIGRIGVILDGFYYRQSQ